MRVSVEVGRSQADGLFDPDAFVVDTRCGEQRLAASLDRVAALLAGRGRREHDSLDGQETLVEFPEGNFDGVQASIESLHTRAHVTQISTKIAHAGVYPGDLGGEQTRHR